jgi:hypothetical protein
MSSSKPGTKKRQGTEASSRRSKKPRGEQEEEAEEPWDFSRWAWQDTKKAPLPSSSASSGGPAVRWLGVQSLASIVLRRDAKVFVHNAISKRGLSFELDFVEGQPQRTYTVLPLDAPAAVVSLFTNSSVAKAVLMNASFVRRLEEAGAEPALLRQCIEELLAELDVYTQGELESLATLCKLREEESQALLRGARKDGELVIAMVDFVMVVKKCGYKTANSICRRLLLEYWNFDMEEGVIHKDASMHPYCLHLVRFRTGRAGRGQDTLCAPAALLAEVLILIPGCELSSQLRKDMVRSFFGVGGSQVTFESLLANPRIQAHLRGCLENPLVEVLEDREQRELVRSPPDVLRQRDEALQLALQPRKRIAASRGCGAKSFLRTSFSEVSPRQAKSSPVIRDIKKNHAFPSSRTCSLRSCSCVSEELLWMHCIWLCLAEAALWPARPRFSPGATFVWSSSSL